MNPNSLYAHVIRKLNEGWTREKIEKHYEGIHRGILKRAIDDALRELDIS